MNIHIGCEHKIGKSWKNYDVSYVAILEKLPIVGKLLNINRKRYPQEVLYGDISKRMLCEENAADNIFCSHTLEHMPKENMIFALKNIYKMLKQNGCFRLIVPDLKARAENYVKTNDADQFIETIGMGHKKSANHFLEKLRGLFGNSLHKWMYDERSMKRYLLEAGFKNIKSCSFNDSNIEVFSEVEDLHRFIDGDFKEVALQCTK
jgi:predicted SAM-dependent methyltransferase